MQPSDGAPAREKILFYLKTKGPETAGQLADRLRVTPMAVRQHLYLLQEEGLVGYEDERRKIGRPARVWRITPAAGTHFPDSHAELAVGMIQAVRAAFGKDGLDRLIVERSRVQTENYRARVGRNGSLAQRLTALAAVRKAEGYMAEWSKEADGTYLFVENNCPICAAAEICQGICGAEQDVFRAVLGDGVHVERTEFLLDGARRCAYRVSTGGPIPVAAGAD